MIGRDFEHRKQGRAARWFVRCDCGKEKTASSASLLSGLTRSCGCLRRETSRVNQQKQSIDRVRNRPPEQPLLRIYKRSAQEKGNTWELADEQFYKLVRQSCHYCGVVPTFTPWVQRLNLTFAANGIDRKDNTQGYTEANTVSCCKICNRAKLTMGYEEFVEYLSRIVTFRSIKAPPWTEKQSV